MSFCFWIGVLAIIALVVWLKKADSDAITLASKLPEAAFEGQVVWIIGASSGIGEGYAYEVAKRGARVILSARRLPELEAIKAKCIAAGAKHEPVLLQLDCLDYAAHKPALEQAIKLCGKVDIVALNAGRSQRQVVTDTDIKQVKELFELNVFAQIALASTILPHFIERKSGQFVLTSSVSGKMGVPISSSYSASKHALHGFFRALESEMGENNISVTMICPGPVVSDLAKHVIGGHDGKQENNSSKMKTERCAYLMAVGTYNKLAEVWISMQPVLLFVYVSQYFPTVGRFLAKKIGPKRVRTFTQGGDVNVTTDWFKAKPKSS